VLAANDVSLRQVAIPSEHGGWSLTLEPALLGLIVAPSLAGAALAVAALLGFLLRTPLKLVFVDRRRGRTLPRTELATRAAVGYLVLLVAALTIAATLGEPSLWPPLIIALPLFAVEFAYDVRSKSRRLIPELVGTIGIGAVVAAIVLADGGQPSLAYGLWMISAARAVAAIPFVRLQLRRSKDQAASVLRSDAAQGLAVLVAAAGVAAAGAPVAAVFAIAGLAGFHVVSSRLAVPKVAVIGAQQVVLGLTVVLITGLAAVAP
jgi:4-hydroxybenzoate polyprenyltransferase